MSSFYRILVILILLTCGYCFENKTQIECGVPYDDPSLTVNSRVFDGEFATRYEFPWKVALYQQKEGNWAYICGGTLVSVRHIVTAAHCIQNKGKESSELPLLVKHFKVKLGSHDLSKENEEGRVEREVKSISIHEKWNTFDFPFGGDIALLELHGEITINEYVRTVCLPEIKLSVSNTKAFLAGWGYFNKSNQISDLPRKIKLNIIPDGECFRNDTRLVPASSDEMFCAGNKGVSVCSGDSGSGLYLKENGKFYLKGLVSNAATDACGDGHLALYSDIEKYMDFMSQNIQDKEHTRKQNKTTISLTFDKSVSDQMERFAVEILTTCLSHNYLGSGNFAISPYLIHRLLTMIAEGASGTTYDEFQKKLNIDDITKFRDFHLYLKIYLKRTGINPSLMGSYLLFIRDKKRPLRNEYIEKIEFNYGATLKVVDYENVRESVDEINKISYDLSGGQINDGVYEDDFRGANLILLAGSSFKGIWKQQFDPSKTSKEKFYDGNGQHAGYVDMMFQRSHLNYTEITRLGCHALEMQYIIPKSNSFNFTQLETELSLIVLLPKINQTLRETTKKLYSYGFIAIYRQLLRAFLDTPMRKVDAFLPKFAIDSDLDFKILLEKWGIHEVFNQSGSDLSKINVGGFLSAALHRIKLDTNEYGSIKTSNSLVKTAKIESIDTTLEKFRVDRPFIFFIVHKLANIPLFAGSFSKPTYNLNGENNTG